MPHDDKITMFHPYVSLKAREYLERVLQSRWIGQGPLVAEFEAKFKETTGLPHAVAVNCGSSAVRLALELAGVGPGDEVVTSPQACTAVNHPILEQYAKPVFADIQYMTGNLDPADVAGRVTKKTKAILCPHWAGYPSDLDELHEIAEDSRLTLIEDASDALGARYKGKAVGSLSRFTCFSFQAVQQITTGEGGMLCAMNTGDEETARRKRWYGIDRINRKPNRIGYYDFDITEKGFGYHLTDLAAAIGLANLEEFGQIMKKRRDICAGYRRALENMDGLTLFESNTDRASANWLFSVHVRDRENFTQAMKSRGIETSIVHVRNDAYTVFGGPRKDLPNLDHFSETYICLPLHHYLRDEDLERIIESIRQGW